MYRLVDSLKDEIECVEAVVMKVMECVMTGWAGLNGKACLAISNDSQI